VIVQGNLIAIFYASTAILSVIFRETKKVPALSEPSSSGFTSTALPAFPHPTPWHVSACPSERNHAFLRVAGAWACTIFIGVIVLVKPTATPEDT
jgi:hypothetical protein